jgi:hypothetical protein
MSWKSKLKSAGIFALKYVVTLGLGALIDKKLKGKAAEIAKGAVTAVITGNIDPRNQLQLAIDQQLKRHVATTLAERTSDLRDLFEKRAEAGLSEQAAQARERGRP